MSQDHNIETGRHTTISEKQLFEIWPDYKEIVPYYEGVVDSETAKNEPRYKQEIENQRRQAWAWYNRQCGVTNDQP